MSEWTDNKQRTYKLNCGRCHYTNEEGARRCIICRKRLRKLSEDEEAILIGSAAIAVVPLIIGLSGLLCGQATVVIVCLCISAVPVLVGSYAFRRHRRTLDLREEVYELKKKKRELKTLEDEYKKSPAYKEVLRRIDKED